MRYGQCIGTCYREFTSLSQSRQLFNACVYYLCPTSSLVRHFSRYMSVLPDHNGVPRVIMRHAVPNSPDRIKMIGAALKSCKIPVKRVRMLSLLTRHGFNEEETMFVEQQRCFESTFPFLHPFDIVPFNFCNFENSSHVQPNLRGILIGISRNLSAFACRRTPTPSSTGRIRARPTMQCATRWPG